MDIYLFSLLVGFLGLTAMAVVGFVGHGHDGSTHAGHDGGGMHVGGHELAGHGLAGHDLGDHVGGHDLAGHDLGGHDLGGHVGLGHGHDGGAGHVHDGSGVHAHDGGHALSPAGHGHVQADGAHGHAGDAHGHAHVAEGTGSALALALLSWLSPRVIFGVLFGVGAAGMLLRDFLPGLLVAVLAVAGGLLFEVGVLRRVWSLLFRFAGAPSSTLEVAWMEVATATTAFDASGDGLVRIELNGEIRQILARLRPEDRQAGVKVHMGDQLRVEEVDPERNECMVAWLGRGDALEQ